MATDVKLPNALFQETIEIANDAVIICEAEPINNPGPLVVFVNDAFHRITGFSREDILGKSPRILQGPGTSSDTKSRIRSALLRWEPIEIEILNYRKNGEPFWSELSIAPRADDSGWFTHWMSVQRDVTARKEAELAFIRYTQRLEEALDQAKAAAYAKNQFLSMMSHELRTPLNAIVGVADLLKDANLADDYYELLDIIDTNSATLLRMFEDVLESSRLKEGDIDIIHAPFNVREGIATIIDSFRTLAAKKSLNVSAHLAPDLPVTALSDYDRIRQVLNNLIENAIKFTDSGAIHISLTRKLNSETPLLHFEIHDTGIGIPEDKIASLFHAFSQVDSGLDRKYNGTGLGLAICKKLADILGGTLWVESEIGVGSCFHFTTAYTLPS